MDELGDLVKVLEQADPAKKSELYESLGLNLVYHPQDRRVTVEADLSMCRVRVGGPTHPWPPSPERHTLRTGKGASVENNSDRFLEAITKLEEVADSVTADEAHRTFDETSLQVFWKKWPDITSWTGSLWRLLNEELAEAAVPPRDPDLDEVGGSG
ncbi:MAG: hypothetical protein ACRDGU_08385 [Actinomycetota bacterium]